MIFNNDLNFWISSILAVIGIIVSSISLFQAYWAKKAALMANKLLSNRNAEIEISKLITKLQNISYKVTYEEADTIIGEITAIGIDQYFSNITNSSNYQSLKTELEANLNGIKNCLQAVLPLSENQEPGIIYTAINEKRYNLIGTFAKVIIHRHSRWL